jgi:4-amino-4-deoxy-L-arabinose transferase-like glycosyltransferase
VARSAAFSHAKTITRLTDRPSANRLAHDVNTLRQHRAFLVVLCFAAVLFLSDIWAYKEFVRAESYFALGARLMIEQGNWLTPHAPDELPLNKPPFTYWLIGCTYKLFGVSYGSARLPSVIAALVTMALVYFLGSRIASKRNGIVASAILGTSYLFMNFARMAMSDMLLALFVTASLSSFIVVLTSAARKSSLLVYLGYVALTLGILTKGPVALALVALPISIELVFSRRREDLAKLQIGRGLILLLIITAPYFLLVYQQAGGGPLRFFFVGENLRRFTGQIYGPAGRPFWYEFVAFFSDFAPWSLLFPIAVWVDRKVRLESSKARAKRLLYLWLASALLLFSVSSFKLDYYLLPVMPAAALIVAPIIAEPAGDAIWLRRVTKLFFVLSATAVLIISLLSLTVAEAFSIHGPLRFLPLAVAAIGVAAILYLVRTPLACSRQIAAARQRRAYRHTTFTTAIGLCVLIAAMMLSLELTFLPTFSRYLPAKQLVSAIPSDRFWFASEAASDWANDVAFNLPAGRGVERLTRADETKLLQVLNNPGAVVLIREREYANLLNRNHDLKILSQGETYGRGGLSVKMLRNPQRERLLVIGR